MPLFTRKELETASNGFDDSYNVMEDESATVYRFEVRYAKHLVKVYKDGIDDAEFMEEVVGAAKLRH